MNDSPSQDAPEVVPAYSSLPPSSESKSSLRTWGFFLLKALITVGLITWLVRSGSLELQQLDVLISSPDVMLATAAAWLSCTMALSTLRWRALLGAVGYRVGFLRSAALQTMALFFNGLVPGNVGGDFLKNHAVMGPQGTRLFILVLVERLVGVISLIWTAAIGIAMSFHLVGENRDLALLTGLLVLMILGSILGPMLLSLILRHSTARPRMESGGGGRVARFAAGILASTLETMQLVRQAKAKIAQAFVLSLAMHLGNMTYFLFLTQKLGNPEADFGQIAMALPVGMLSLALPISISGMGVGHVMFDELFEIVGLVGGATIFNVYLVAQLSPCLLGAIPYLFMRSKATPETGA